MSTTTATATCYKTRSTIVGDHELYRLVPTLSRFIAKINGAHNFRDKINWIHKLYIIINKNMLLVCENKILAQTVYDTAVRSRQDAINILTNNPELEPRVKYATTQMDKFIEYYLDHVYEHDIMLK